MVGDLLSPSIRHLRICLLHVFEDGIRSKGNTFVMLPQKDGWQDSWLPAWRSPNAGCSSHALGCAITAPSFRGHLPRNSFPGAPTNNDPGALRNILVFSPHHWPARATNTLDVRSDQNVHSCSQHRMVRLVDKCNLCIFPLYDRSLPGWRGRIRHNTGLSTTLTRVLLLVRLSFRDVH